MPVRHFLRSDYLHIFFSIKFLVFVSLVPQISILFYKFVYCFIQCFNCFGIFRFYRIDDTG